MVNGEVSEINSTMTPLGIGGEYIGEAEINVHDSVMCFFNTDQNGVLYMEFSHDGKTWTDSSISFNYTVGKFNPPQVLVKGYRYYRTRFENTSGVAQTYLRITTMYGQFGALISTVNSVVSQTYSATVVKPIDFNLLMAKGNYDGHSIINKDGVNPDIATTASLAAPEDFWSLGGSYTGFPSAAAAAEIVVAGADTGTVYYFYMATDTDTQYTQGTIEITGAGTYPLGHDIYRCNYMYFDNGSTINVGLMTIRHTATPANVFVQILASQGQSFCSAYTVPKGRSAYIDRINTTYRGSNTGSSEGFWYWKEDGKSPILRFPFVISQGSYYFDDVDYINKVEELTDIMPRIVASTGNNVSGQFTYRLIEVVD